MCGIIGVYLKPNKGNLLSVPSMLVHGLSLLQHRGQKSAGIATFRPLEEGEEKRKTLLSYKGVGRVAEVFRLRHSEDYKRIIERCQGIAGIGHTRYSTSGKREDYYSSMDEAQPFIRRHPRAWKKFAIAFNGNIANYDALLHELEHEGLTFETNVDTEVLIDLLSISLRKQGEREDMLGGPDLFNVLQTITKKIDGAYNLLILFGDGRLLAYRDACGFHPLVLGENEDMYAVASESAAFEKMGIESFSDILPGEAVLITEKGIERRQLVSPQPKHCHFEWVYFSKANSTLDGKKVREVRKALGEALALHEPLKDQMNEDYLVVPAPKTAIPAAEAYAWKLGLQMSYAIDKNEAERGFINAPQERQRIMKSNYIVHDDVAGKKVIVVDDSLIRGETAQILIQQLKKAKAKEVHLRFTEPPVLSPCFYGIDYPSKKELLAGRVSEYARTVEDLQRAIAQQLGAESVVFQTKEDLVRALGIPANRLCMACITGEYPTLWGKKLAESQKE